MSDAPPTITTPDRPFFRYHGGKWLIAPWVVDHMPAHRHYVEPFCGAASVLMRKPRSYSEVINDRCDEIYNLFMVARDHGEELLRAVTLTPFSRKDFLDSYKRSKKPVEQARRTLVRSFMGFGSNAHQRVTGFRQHSKQSGTSPAGDWMGYPDSLALILQRLKGVTIENSPAEKLFDVHDTPETLFYLDPPYPKSSRDKGRDYRFEMTDDDHRALAARVRRLKGMVMISGYACQLYDELFCDWHCERKSALADGARARTECLWMNPAAFARHPSPALFVEANPLALTA